MRIDVMMSTALPISKWRKSQQHNDNVKKAKRPSPIYPRDGANDCHIDATRASPPKIRSCLRWNRMMRHTAVAPLQLHRSVNDNHNDAIRASSIFDTFHSKMSIHQHALEVTQVALPRKTLPFKRGNPATLTPTPKIDGSILLQTLVARGFREDLLYQPLFIKEPRGDLLHPCPTSIGQVSFSHRLNTFKMGTQSSKCSNQSSILLGTIYLYRNIFTKVAP